MNETNSSDLLLVEDNSYIVKPVDFERFTESVRSLGLYWLLLNKPRRELS